MSTPPETPETPDPTAADSSTGSAAGRGARNPDEMPLDALVGEWLTLPDAAEVLGVEVSAVRRMVDDGALVEMRRGTPKVRSVPAGLILDGQPAPYLAGTVTVLRDAGLHDDELLRWLFTPDDSLPGRPIDELRAGHRGEVRRRAQTLAF